MVVYTGSIEDSRELIQFLRREAEKLRNLRRLIVTREKTVVRDVNGDELEFPGLTYGSAVLEELLRELGVIFSPQALHNPNATPDGVKEFRLSARWTWGHERVMLVSAARAPSLTLGARPACGSATCGSVADRPVRQSTAE